MTTFFILVLFPVGGFIAQLVLRFPIEPISKGYILSEIYLKILTVIFFTIVPSHIYQVEINAAEVTFLLTFLHTTFLILFILFYFIYESLKQLKQKLTIHHTSLKNYATQFNV